MYSLWGVPIYIYIHIKLLEKCGGWFRVGFHLPFGVLGSQQNPCLSSNLFEYCTLGASNQPRALQRDLLEVPAFTGVKLLHFIAKRPIEAPGIARSRK